MITVIKSSFIIFLLLLGNITFASSISSSLCKDTTRFTCYTAKRGDSWKKLFPDDTQRDLVMRINRTNQSLERGKKIVIPTNLETATKLEYAPLPQTISAPGEKVIHVSLDPSVLAWGAYDAQGVLQSWGPVSGGKSWCPDLGRACRTAVGKFAIYEKRGAGCVSTKFPIGRGGAPMPYCMFFHGGFALHGSHDVPGYNASHGCVRLLVPDAKWLNQDFVMGEKVAVIISR